jgi:hypothetical protein
MGSERMRCGVTPAKDREDKMRKGEKQRRKGVGRINNRRRKRKKK